MADESFMRHLRERETPGWRRWWRTRAGLSSGTGQPPPRGRLDLAAQPRAAPLRIRRHVLEAEVDGHRLILPARRLAEDGLAAWAEVIKRGYEGLVAKDPASHYVGGRTLKWLKVKQAKYREGERGWEPKGKS